MMILNNIRVKCEISGKPYHFKSKAEHRFALYLEFLRQHQQIASWDYEPKTFWFDGIKRGCVSYKPDFLSLELNGKINWYEVKGYMDKRSQTKIKRFRSYFPEETLIVIDSKWFGRNSKKLKGLIPGWV